MNGEVNVIVADGFTGNVALKTAEGTANFISKNLIREDSSIMINERHYSCLNKVKESIENVKKNIANKSNTDLLAMDIKYALNHLGEITGEITNDEILGNIFSKFCIGK